MCDPLSIATFAISAGSSFMKYEADQYAADQQNEMYRQNAYAANKAAQQQAFDIQRRVRHRRLENRDGSVRVSERQQQGRAAGPRVGRLRLDPDRVPILLDGALEVPHILGRDRGVVAGPGVVGPEPEGFVELLKR